MEGLGASLESTLMCRHCAVEFARMKLADASIAASLLYSAQCHKSQARSFLTSVKSRICAIIRLTEVRSIGRQSTQSR